MVYWCDSIKPLPECFSHAVAQYTSAIGDVFLYHFLPEQVLYQYSNSLCLLIPVLSLHLRISVFLLFGKTADMPDASIYFCRQCFPAYCPFLNAILVKCFHDSRCMNKDFHSLLEVFCCYSCVLPHPFQDCVLCSYSDLCMMLLRRDSTIS